MMIGILQPSYLPWLGYFEQISRADVFVFYDDVQFEKGSFRNRNRIKTPSGPFWLTVPVLTRNRGPQLINDVVIDHKTGWGDRHVKTITQYYSRARYFNRYADDIFGVILKSFNFLSELNTELTLCLMKALGINTPTIRSSELGITGERTERIIKIVEHLNGNAFYEGAAGRAYLDPAVFARRGIRLLFQDYRHPSYTQFFGDFTPFLSVIDLIFHHGPESLEILSAKQDPV